MSRIADTMNVGCACIEIIQDDEAMAAIGWADEGWLWVVSVPGCECKAYATHTYWGAFDGLELMQDAMAAAEAADHEWRMAHALAGSRI